MWGARFDARKPRVQGTDSTSAALSSSCSFFTSPRFLKVSIPPNPFAYRNPKRPRLCGAIFIFFSSARVTRKDSRSCPLRELGKPDWRCSIWPWPPRQFSPFALYIKQQCSDGDDQSLALSCKKSRCRVGLEWRWTSCIFSCYFVCAKNLRVERRGSRRKVEMLPPFRWRRREVAFPMRTNLGLLGSITCSRSLSVTREISVRKLFNLI